MSYVNTTDNGLLVVGMHRSGTSCLAGMLQLAGFFTGLVEEWSPDNNKGSRENSAIVNLNDSLLSSAGGSWQKTEVLLAPSERQIQKRDHILQQLDSKKLPWMFKDPRTLFTLPFWLDAIPEVRMIGIFRNPVSVANSLLVRNSIPINEGLRLWKAYNQRLLDIIEQKNTPLLYFSHDLKGLLESTQLFLEENFSKEVHNGVLRPEQMQKFISSDLIHHSQPTGKSLFDTLMETDLSEGESESINKMWESLLGSALNQHSNRSTDSIEDAKMGSDENRSNFLNRPISDLVERNKVKVLLRELEKTLSIYPKRSDLWRQGVELIKAEGNTKQLSLWLNKGLAFDPANPLLLCELAKIIWQTGDQEKAIVTMERARKHSPGWPPALNLLSKWYYAREDWQKAASALNELSIRSHLEPAELKFAQLFINTGKGLSEEESIRLPINLNNKPQEHEFDLTSYNQIHALRFDPINDYAVVRVHDIKIYDAQDEELSLKRIGSNAQYVKEDNYYFNVIDTQIELQISETIRHLPCKLIAKVQYLYTGAPAVLECFKIAKQQIEKIRPSDQGTSPELPSETKSFLTAWKLEGIDTKGNKTGETLLQGWFIPKNNARLNVALRYDGLTRSYPLNVNRPDLSGYLSEDGVEKMEHVNFGFKYAVPKSSIIKIGIEHEMRIHWIDTVLT